MDYIQISQTGLSTPLGGHRAVLQRPRAKPSLGSFAEAFPNIAKFKCHDIKYSPVKLKFVVFIITLYTFLVTFGDAFYLECSGVIKCQKFASGARATSLCAWSWIKRSVFTTRS